MPFEELRFQSRAYAMLTRALRHGRHAHAYLLVGPEGTGKHLAARLFAQALNCERQDGDACGLCPSCDSIARSMDPDQVVHPDIWHILPGRGVGADGRQQASHTILIDTIRELCGRLYSAPLQARYRVVILHEADTMQVTAQNAFLKTLEEPLESLRTVFILMSAKPRALLPTIHSRTQVVRFATLDEAELKARLVREGAEEGAAELAARLALGSPLEAERWLNDDDARERRRRWLGQWHARVCRRPAEGDLVESIGRSRDDVDTFLGLLLVWHRDLLALRLGLGRESIINLDCLEWLQAEAAHVTTEVLLTRVERILALRGAQELYIRGDLALQSLLADA